MDRDPFDAVAQRIAPGGRLRRFWPLEGGVSATMHGLEISVSGGAIRRVVSRRHGAADWKPLAEDVTATEFALLETLHRLGFPVPEPCFLDTSGELFPTPCFVMELIEGSTTVKPAVVPEAMRQMALFLARLHALDLQSSQLPSLPHLEDPLEGLKNYLPSTEVGDRVRAALADGELSSPVDQTTTGLSLLHGDFWPGNVLWQHDRLAAVLDWEDATIGDPLSDLACCRVELLCKYDEAAMKAFTEHYCAHTEVELSELALWEVYVSSAALATMGNWGLEPDAERKRRRKTLTFFERAARDLLSRHSER